MSKKKFVTAVAGGATEYLETLMLNKRLRALLAIKDKRIKELEELLAVSIARLHDEEMTRGLLKGEVRP